MTRVQTEKSPRRGTAQVHYAALIGAVVIVLLGASEYARFVMARQVVDRAAREGADLASSPLSAMTTSDVRNRVTSSLVGQPLANLNVRIYRTDADGADLGASSGAEGGEPVVVQLDCTYAPMVPTFGLLPNALRLHSKRVMRSQAD